jgi:hypothetical protein
MAQADSAEAGHGVGRQGVAVGVAAVGLLAVRGGGDEE